MLRFFSYPWRRLSVWLAVALVLPLELVGMPPVVGAVSWTQVENVSRSPGSNSLSPALAIDSTGGVHAVWLEDAGGLHVFYASGRREGWARTSIDDLGPVGGDLASLTDNLGPGYARPAIAAEGDAVHIVWGNSDSGQVMYARYDVNGNRTISPRAIGTGNVPAVAARGATVAVVWQQFDGSCLGVHYRSSPDGGAGWGNEEVPSGGQCVGVGQAVALDPAGHPLVAFATSSRALYATYRQPGGWEGLSRRGNGYWPNLVADNAGTVNLVYQGYDQDIHFQRWAGGGWAADVQVYGSPGLSQFPRIAWDGSNNLLHVVWQEQADNGSYNLFYSSSGNGGSSWGPTENATVHGGAKDVSPDLKALNGNLNLIYAEAGGGQPYDIWFQCTLCTNQGGAPAPPPPAPPAPPAGPPPPPAPPADPFGRVAGGFDNPAVLYFPETSHTVGYGFRQFWEGNGGLARFGLPLSEEFTEPDLNGGARDVQYFERARFEYHPEFAGTPYEVELGLLGRELAAGRLGEAPFQPVAPPEDGDCAYDPDAAHAVCGAFLAAWNERGGLPLLGLPLSEEFIETGAAGTPRVVQYFERARLERPDEAAGADQVQLGLLGREYLLARGWLR